MVRSVFSDYVWENYSRESDIYIQSTIIGGDELCAVVLPLTSNGYLKVRESGNTDWISPDYYKFNNKGEITIELSNTNNYIVNGASNVKVNNSFILPSMGWQIELYDYTNGQSVSSKSISMLKMYGKSKETISVPSAGTYYIKLYIGSNSNAAFNNIVSLDGISIEEGDKLYSTFALHVDAKEEIATNCSVSLNDYLYTWYDKLGLKSVKPNNISTDICDKWGVWSGTNSLDRSLWNDGNNIVTSELISSIYPVECISDDVYIYNSLGELSSNQLIRAQDIVDIFIHDFGFDGTVEFPLIDGKGNISIEFVGSGKRIKYSYSLDVISGNSIQIQQMEKILGNFGVDSVVVNFTCISDFKTIDTNQQLPHIGLTFGGDAATLPSIGGACTVSVQRLPDRIPTYSIDLGDEWRLSSTVPNPDAIGYEGPYESFSNYNVHGGVSTMKIYLHDCETFTLYIRSYAESNYDYVMVSQLDKEITGTTSYSNTSLVKAHTRGNQKSGTDIGSYTMVTYSGIGGGSHEITIVYRKDSSGNTGDDRGYVLFNRWNSALITRVYESNVNEVLTINRSLSDLKSIKSIDLSGLNVVYGSNDLIQIERKYHKIYYKNYVIHSSYGEIGNSESEIIFLSNEGDFVSLDGSIVYKSNVHFSVFDDAININSSEITSDLIGEICYFKVKCSCSGYQNHIYLCFKVNVTSERFWGSFSSIGDCVIWIDSTTPIYIYGDNNYYLIPDDTNMSGVINILNESSSNMFLHGRFEVYTVTNNIINQVYFKYGGDRNSQGVMLDYPSGWVNTGDYVSFVPFGSLSTILEWLSVNPRIYLSETYIGETN